MAIISKYFVLSGAIALFLITASSFHVNAHSLEKPDSENFDERQAIAFSEASVGREIGRYTFIDSENNIVQFEQYRGKPLIISLIYTSCKDVCPTVSQSIAAAVDTALEVFGPTEFNVLTIGFDDRFDTPKRMRNYKSAQGLIYDNWTFVSADHATIERFSKNLGFLYYKSSKGFDHMTRTTVVDSKGIIYKHVYGESFVPPLLMEPLKDLLFGRKGNVTSIDGIINQIRLFCTIYDPNSGRYLFDMSIFISGFVGLTLIFTTGFFLVRILLARWRRPWKSNRSVDNSTGD